MKGKGQVILVPTLVLLGALALVVVSRVALGAGAASQGGAPSVVSYQGEVRVDGEPYSGTGYLEFAIIGPPATSTHWSNDGSSQYGVEPVAAVPLPVAQGLFSVLLGDTGQAGMTEPLTADVFGEPDRALRVWFSTTGGEGTFEQLARMPVPRTLG